MCLPSLKPFSLASVVQAGEALKVISSVVPVFGGLASFAAAALKAGDRHIQTRRVVKVGLLFGGGASLPLLHDGFRSM